MNWLDKYSQVGDIYVNQFIKAGLVLSRGEPRCVRRPQFFKKESSAYEKEKTIISSRDKRDG